MKFITVLLLVLLVSFPLFSQKILLDKDINQAYKKVQGPNTKFFGQLFTGTGLIIAGAEGNDVQINIWRSMYYSFGYRQKYKIFSLYSIGFETEYFARQFNIRQTDNKVVPNSEIHDKEKLKIHSAGFSVYNRINFGKRGNVIGKFIDIGGFLNYNFSTVHFTKDKISGSDDPSENNVNARVRIVKYSQLDYFQPFEYGVYGRAGINWFAVKAGYRFTDLFREKYTWNELPRFYAGIEVSFPY